MSVKNFEEKKMRLNQHLDYLKQLIIAKSGTLPVVSSLAATILVVATFNKELIPMSSGIKICLIILLLMIPVSLLFYMTEVTFSIFATRKAIEEIIEQKLDFNYNFWKKNYNFILFFAPFFFCVVLFGVIVYVIKLIIICNF